MAKNQGQHSSSLKRSPFQNSYKRSPPLTSKAQHYLFYYLLSTFILLEIYLSFILSLTWLSEELTPDSFWCLLWPIVCDFRPLNPQLKCERDLLIFDIITLWAWNIAAHFLTRHIGLKGVEYISLWLMMVIEICTRTT